MSRSTALHCNLTLLVVIVGIAGVVHDSLARSVPASYMNLHALFGALLWVSVVARFQWRLRQSPRMLPIEIREFSRHLSRLVYLMLYILMFISLITGALTCTWRSDCAAPPDFQGYLGYGFFVLITIHLLAAICRHPTCAMVFSETGGSHSANRPVQIAMGGRSPWRFQFVGRTRR